MKNYKWSYIAYGVMWVSVAIAVSIGIYITKSPVCLWALFVPTFVSLKHPDNEEE